MKAWVATSAAIVIKLFLEFFALYVPIDQLPRSDVENLFRDSLVSCPFSLVPDFSGANGAAVIDHPIGSKRFLSYRDVRWSTLVAKARYVAMLYNETAAEDIVDWLTEQALVFDLVKFDRIMKAGLIYLIVFVVSLMWLDTSESDLGSRKRAFFHAIAKILSREFHLFLHLRIIVSATFVGWSIRNESDEKNPLDSEFVIIWSILVFSVRTVLHMARCRLTEQVDHEAATAKTHDMFAFYRIASIALVCLTISSLVTTLPVMSGVLLSPLYRTFMLLDGVNLVAQSSGMLSVTLARVQRHAREPATPPMLLVFQLGAQMSELAFYAFALSFGFFWRTRVLALALVPLCVELGSALCKDLRLLREPEKVNLEAEEDEESRTLLQE